MQFPTKEAVWPNRGVGEAQPTVLTISRLPEYGSSSNKSFLLACLPMPPKPPKMITFLTAALFNPQAEWPQRKSFPAGSPTISKWLIDTSEPGVLTDPANHSKIQTFD